MIIWTIKANKLKYYLSMALAVTLIASTFVFFPKAKGDLVYPEGALPTVQTMSKKALRGIETNEDRVALLEKFGWKVDPEPKEIQEVTVPQAFDSVYETYNQMQLSEGMDLKKVAGKQVKRYTYVVTDANYEGTVLANLLIHKNELVGGDVCSARLDGFVHGLSREADFLRNDPS